MRAGQCETANSEAADGAATSSRRRAPAARGANQTTIAIATSSSEQVGERQPER